MKGKILLILAMIVLIINGVNIVLDYTNEILKGILNNEFESPLMLWVWIKMTITIIITMIVGYVYKSCED